MHAYAIAVCGAGIGGLAAAVALTARGHDVTLFEKVADPAPVGSGLMLQPTGQSALARLGLFDPVLALGRCLHGIHGTDRQGRTILDVRYDTLGPSTFGIGIHRGALFHVLDAERRRCAIPVVTSADIATTASDGPKRILTARSGTTFGPFDLVVDATGLRSALRRTYAVASFDRPYPYGAVWGAVEEPSDWPMHDQLAQRYDGAHTMAGLLPMGRLPGSERPLTALFWSLRTSDVETWRRQDFASWRDRVTTLWPASAPFVAQLHGHADLAVATYNDLWLKTPIHDRLVFIGDAARAASPQLGQGANLALVDALVLADSLTEQPTIAAALRAFADARRAHTLFYSRASRLLTPFFQSDSRLAGFARDALLPPLSKVPYVAREMTRTLAGVKAGLLRTRTAEGLAGAKPNEPVRTSPNCRSTAPAAD